MAASHDRVPPATEQALGALLVRDGLLSSSQLLAVQQYGWEHNLDLLQSILKLKLIPEEKLHAALAEKGSMVAVDHQAPGPREANGSTPAPAAGSWRVNASQSVGTFPVLSSGPMGNLALPIPVPAGANSPQSPTSTVPVPVEKTGRPTELAPIERDLRKELTEIASSAASSDLVAQIFDRAIETRATDIHFDPQEASFRIRFRIDGQLHDVVDLEPAYTTSLVSRLKVLSNMNIVERRHSQDGRIQYRHRELIRDLRVATLPTALGEKVVIRIHEASNQAYGFDMLGLNPEQSELLAGICAKPYGAVLVAGPVGAGKTTTLYTCLNRVNVSTRNVMTIEDPIERRVPGVNQLQVDNRIDMTFGSGLRSMLRQDPDVIMIGEIRDEETAHIGIRAALTGVLVFSTIHASDAPSTLGNLYDFKIPGYLLSNTLLAVISQRLLRKICTYCKVSFEATEQQISMLGLDPSEHKGLTLSRGEGCPACFQTGYLGRSGIFEILDVNETIRELIFQQIAKDVLRRVASDMGMRTLRQSAVDKVLDGSTTLEEVYRVVSM